MSSGAVPVTPTPDDLAAFMPFACGRLLAPFRVHFKTHMQEEYISKADAKSAKKSRAALAHAVASRPQAQGSPIKDESRSMSVSASVDQDDNSEIYVLQTVIDSAKHVLEITINPCREVPRLLVKILALCIPFNPYLNKLTMRCGLSGATLYETVNILNTSHITEVCLDDSRVPDRNYYLLLEYQTHLQFLSLARCNITDEDCSLLMAKLAYPHPASKTLNTLILSGNYISDKGACQIGLALRSNRALLYLNLSGNTIFNEGAIQIFRSLMEFPLTKDEITLKRNRTLYYLKLRKEVYTKCFNELLAAQFDGPDEFSRSSKRRNTVLLRQRTTTNSTPINNNIVLKTEFIALKAEKMTSELVGFNKEPFRVEATVSRDNVLYSMGNLSLCYLNLAYNNLGKRSLKKLVEVVRYQSLVAKYPDLGLTGVQLDGNPMPWCRELDKLSEMLTRALEVRLVYTATSHRTYKKK